MAKKLIGREIDFLPRVHILRSYNSRIKKFAKKTGARKFDVGLQVIKAGMEALGI